MGSEMCIRDRDNIKGVKVRLKDGELYGDCIILADGVNSLLAKKLGLHEELPRDKTAIAVKEVLSLSEDEINRRFGLNEKEGSAYEYFGYACKGAIGSGFIYTNKDTISIGVGATISSLIEKKLNPNDVLEFFKDHPVIAPLIKDAEQKEYSAHLIPEGGYKKLSKLYRDNILVVGDAAGFVNTSLFHEGTNLAMVTGKLAGETVIYAKEKNDFSEKTLSIYKEKLNSSFAMKDLKQFKKVPDALEKNKKIFDTYPPVSYTHLTLPTN